MGNMGNVYLSQNSATQSVAHVEHQENRTLGLDVKRLGNASPQDGVDGKLGGW